MFIVAFHYGSEGPVELERFSPMFARGYIATNFFLMVSGYVLVRAYGRAIVEARITSGEFLRRRLVRIWPAHLVVLATLAAVVCSGELLGARPRHPELFEWRDLISQAALVQAWGVNLGGAGWNLPTWSLSALIVCYAAFPWVVRAMSRCPSALAVCAAVALVVAVDLVCRAALGRRLYDLPFQYGALRALPLFVLGASLARVRSPRRLAGWPSLALGGACAVTLVALQSLGRFDTATLALTAGLILLSDAMFGARRFGWVEAAGNVSYALFISHILVATTWFGLLHHVEPHQPAWVGWTLLAAGVVLALGVAVLFDQLIDRPLQRRLRQFRSMPTPAAV